MFRKLAEAAKLEIFLKQDETAKYIHNGVNRYDTRDIISDGWRDGCRKSMHGCCLAAQDERHGTPELRRLEGKE